jgi:assimilatory nitrate reductase catalytic subunit
MTPQVHPESESLTTHCCYCSMQCGMVLHPKAEGGFQIKPSQDFPVATGRLCQKGLNAQAHTVHESRVMHPLKKTERGEWMESSWDHAYEQITAKLGEIQNKYGLNAAAVYGGGSLTNEVCYLLGKFARVALKTKYIDYNGRYCMSSAAAAGNQAFGVDRGLTMPLSEIPQANFIILAGTNIAECQPTMMPYLLEAKKKGATIVTIDPRNTMTSKVADIHIRLQPGFDSVLVNGLLHVILNEDLYDKEFVAQRTEGIAELKEAVAPYTSAEVERMTGVLEPVLRTVARGFAKAETGIVLTARGLEQQINGVENTLNYINLCLLTGKIGKEGSGYGAVTGQANGQGGREHGQKADQLPGYRSIEDPSAREYVASVWGIAPDELPYSGVSAYEMMENIHKEEIKALIVLGSNPIVSSPNSLMVEEALKKLDLLVVVDMFESETAEIADWLLPAASFLEQEGSLTNLEGRVFHRPQVNTPPNQCKTDIQIISDLAKHLGRGQYFQFDTAEAVFNELRLASKGGRADYNGITYNRLKEEKGIFWPCPSEDHPGTPRMFGNSFYHKNGKAKIHGITPRMPAESIDEIYPYILTTGRVGSHYLSGTQTRRTEALNKKTPVPIAEIHPWLAQKLGLRKDSVIKITSRRASLVFEVKITEAIQPRTVFVPFHWGGEQSINRLTIGALEPTSRMPEFKICAVQVEAMNL